MHTESGDFGIGVYQSISQGQYYGGSPLSYIPYMVPGNSQGSINPATYQGGVSLSNVVASAPTNPWSGLYGGTYGYALDTSVPSPNRATYTPAQETGIDTLGSPVVRGYPQISWSWSTLKADAYTYLQSLYQLAGHSPYGYQYVVLLQYPDPLKTSGVTQVLARWEPITHGDRDVVVFHNVVCKFTYVGQLQLDASVPVVLASSFSS